MLLHVTIFHIWAIFIFRQSLSQPVVALSKEPKDLGLSLFTKKKMARNTEIKDPNPENLYT